MTTTTTSGAAIQRYKIGYHSDEWGVRSLSPSGIYDDAGPWVRYADHVTALAAGKATAAQQPGAAYEALPDEGEPWRGHKFKEVQRGCWRCDCGKTIKEVTSDQSTPASGGNYPVMPKRYTVDDDGEELFTAEKMRAFADATHTLRASHGQASSQAGEYPALVCDYCGALTPDPWHSSGMLHGKMSKHIHSCDDCWRGAAQAAPAYKDSTPELHIGDSAFESWYSTYSPAHKSDKQRARDAYAAGMGDPLVTAAPAVAGPSLYQVMAVAKAIHATTPDADDWDSLRQCEVDALRGRAEKVLAALAAAPTQPSPAVQGDENA